MWCRLEVCRNTRMCALNGNEYVNPGKVLLYSRKKDLVCCFIEPMARRQKLGATEDETGRYCSL